MADFPTSLAARRCFQAEIDGCIASIGWTIARSGSLALGMYLAGEREKLLAKSIAGSLAVETFVALWSLAHLNEPEAHLPSSDAALAGEPLPIVATYLARVSMVYAGLRLAGFRKHAWRNAFAGTAVIEASMLIWANTAARGSVIS